jgi:hypothetical protein
VKDKFKGQLSVAFKLENAPKWLDELAITRKGDTVHFEILKESGYVLADLKVPIERFVDLMDKLIDEAG